MNVGSFFSGIGGFELGLQRAGMKTIWQVENDPFCRKILTRHWPDIPKYGDIKAVDFAELERVDLICGGFPCQDLSVAGTRAGLVGKRSQLFWEAIRGIRILEPRWVLIENVYGLLTSKAGRDFRSVISALDELGYGLAWRVLDSQNFGVAQRRRRVFIVGYLGGPCPPEVLFEPESLSRDTQTGRKAGQDVAYPLRTRTGINGSPERNDETFPLAVPSEHWAQNGGYTSALTTAYGPSNYTDGKEWHELRKARALNGDNREGSTSALVAGTVTQRSGSHTGNSNPIAANLVSQTIGTHLRPGNVGNDANVIASTPTNADRMRNASGLPEELDTDRRGEPDTPRYKALGNAVTVNVAEWIGRRINGYRT